MINMDIISKLPEKKGIIGTKEVVKAINTGKVKHVVVASNCPEFLIKKIQDVKLEKFEGDQKMLGTKLGYPFPVAMVGFSE